MMLTKKLMLTTHGKSIDMAEGSVYLSKDTSHYLEFLTDPSGFFIIPIYQDGYFNEELFNMIGKICKGPNPCALISPDMRIVLIFDETMAFALVGDYDQEFLKENTAHIMDMATKVSSQFLIFIENYDKTYKNFQLN